MVLILQSAWFIKALPVDFIAWNLSRKAADIMFMLPPILLIKVNRIRQLFAFFAFVKPN